MQTVTDNMRLEAALHQANQALRFGRQKNFHDRDRSVARMYDTLESCDYPYFTASRLIKRLGEAKAHVVHFSTPLINLALKMEHS